MRLVVGSTAFAYGAGYLATTTGTPVFGVWLVGILEIVFGILLIVGFLTPIVSVLATLVGICLAFGIMPRTAYTHFTRLGVLDAAAVALALAILGAGAFSLDAYLFGRREIIIPDISHPSEH